jgi:hypothetical protein
MGKAHCPRMHGALPESGHRRRDCKDEVQLGAVQKSERDVLIHSMSCRPDAAGHNTFRTGTASLLWHRVALGVRALSRSGTRLALF